MIIFANTKNLLFEYTIQAIFEMLFKEENVINIDRDILYSTDSSNENTT